VALQNQRVLQEICRAKGDECVQYVGGCRLAGRARQPKVVVLLPQWTRGPATQRKRRGSDQEMRLEEKTCILNIDDVDVLGRDGTSVLSMTEGSDID
jgi:hypothetical protein